MRAKQYVWCRGSWAAKEAGNGFINIQKTWALLTEKMRTTVGSLGDPSSSPWAQRFRMARGPTHLPGVLEPATCLPAPARRNRSHAARCHLSVLVTTCFRLVRWCLWKEPLESTSLCLRGPRMDGKGRASARSRTPQLWGQWGKPTKKCILKFSRRNFMKVTPTHTGVPQTVGAHTRTRRECRAQRALLKCVKWRPCPPSARVSKGQGGLCFSLFTFELL